MYHDKQYDFFCFFIKTTSQVFPLAFLPLNTRHVFFLLLFRPYTHFSPLHMPTSFRFGFSCLLFSLLTHSMCFFSYFSPHTHTFHHSTCRLASKTGFPLAFLPNKHTQQKTTAYLTIHGGSKLLFNIYFRK